MASKKHHEMVHPSARNPGPLTVAIRSYAVATGVMILALSVTGWADEVNSAPALRSSDIEGSYNPVRRHSSPRQKSQAEHERMPMATDQTAAAAAVTS
jgi:hypothetical protein